MIAHEHSGFIGGLIGIEDFRASDFAPFIIKNSQMPNDSAEEILNWSL